MNLTQDINHYDERKIYFSDPIKNNIMTDGTFTRIIYSDEKMVFNCISMFIMFNDIVVEKYYNKYKCHFDMTTPYHKQLINKLQKIEDSILSQISIKNKIKQNKLYEQLVDGNIRFFLETELNESYIRDGIFILKISGVWENENQYGLTFKFVKIKSTVNLALSVSVK